MDEQECAVAAVERETLFCGMRSRICDDSCHWRPWSEVSGGGECEAGTVETVTEGCTDGLSAQRQCGDDCRWGEPGVCVATCARAPMPSRTGADVVCVPEGPFVLGTEPYVIEGRTRDDALPIRTIVLSDFWIERTPVSKRRMDACFAAGACSEFSVSVWRELYDALPADALAVVEAPLPGAEFCEWDGGRLPSEFQWEKAARGPHPDARRHSWGDDDGDCRHHPGPTCPVGPLFVDDYPLAVSPFGVRFLGVLREHTRSLRPVDEDDDDYAGLDERDPEGYPIPELAYAVDRGFGWTPDDGVPPTASIRLPGDGRTGIRCVY